MQASSLIANIFLSVASLIFFLMVTELHFKPAPRGGDYAVGHAWAVFLLNGAFFALIALAALAIGWRGGFQWVGAGSGSRFGLVLLGVLAVTLATGFSSAGPGPGSKLLNPIAQVLAFFVPLAALTAGFLLANDKLSGGVPSSTSRLIALLAFVPSTVFFGTYVGVVMLFPRLQRTYTMLTRDRGQLDDFEQNILVNIDACDISKDLVFMLVHTDDNRKPIIRERALAKIKTHPDWQGELARRLDSGWASEVFTFLASNEVDDKTLFPEAVRKGILNQAEEIRKSMRNSRDFYADSYSWEVRRLLRTVEKYEGMGVDYLPAMRDLRAAFDKSGPDQEKRPYRCIPLLDKWIKKRE